MKTLLKSCFLDHPHSVNETYFGHLGFALGISSKMFCAGLAAFIHALLPFLFETTASDILADLNEILQEKRKVAHENQQLIAEPAE